MKDEGLRQRMLDFFIKRPANELTYLEAAETFDCSLRYAHEVGRELVLAGELEYVRVIRRPAQKRLLAGAPFVRTASGARQ